MLRKSPIIWICLPFLLLIVWLLWPSTTSNRALNVAKAKGQTVAIHALTPSTGELALRDLVQGDTAFTELAQGRELEYLYAIDLGSAENRAYADLGCTDSCVSLTFYNHTDGGTVEAIMGTRLGPLLTVQTNPTARPKASPYLIERVTDIAAADSEVQALLGDIRRAKVAMVPMSMWLSDDGCASAWCVDLTFHDPAGSGKIVHVVVNLEEDTVARTFFTRGREARLYQERVELDENAPRYTDGCHEQNGWELCWEMTADDALNIYDVSFEAEPRFESVKISQVEAYYPSWPGGYRDELGYGATVPPKFDTRIADVDGGFELRQMFTEEFNWPNCICCYRYEQVMTFYDDGGYATEFVSHGPGCDDLSEYRPFWRIDLADDSEQALQVWRGEDWEAAETEAELSLYEDLGLDSAKFALGSEGDWYQWEPQRTDPFGLDDGKLFFVQDISSEGDANIPAGEADTYNPPRLQADGQPLDDNLVIWLVPNLQTKQGGPWYCQPDPEPEVNPCSAVVNVRRVETLAKPSPEEIERLQPTAVPAAIEPDDPAPRPTPRPIAGVSAEELYINGGCGACHVVGELGEEGKVGPSLSNIGNIAAERVPGQSAEEYIYNSILYPNLYLVEECPNGPCMENIMPGDYYLRMSEEQVSTMVDYLVDQKLAIPIAAADSAETTTEATAVSGGIEPTVTQPSQPLAPTDTTLPVQAIIFGIVAVVLLAAVMVLARNRRSADQA